MGNFWDDNPTSNVRESIVVITDDAHMVPQFTVATTINSKPIIRAIQSSGMGNSTLAEALQSSVQMAQSYEDES